MTITVETGSVVSGANSYASESELAAYALNRGVSLTVAVSQLLLKSMDYLESLEFKGIKQTQSQPLQWPRSWVEIDGFSVGANTIPQELKNAQMAIALEINAGNNPLAAISRAVKREKVDVVETEYMDNASNKTLTPSITAALTKLLKYQGRRMVRA